MSTQLREFLRLKKVLEATGMSRSQLYLLEKAGKFPARFAIGVRSVAWDAQEVAAWQHQRITAAKMPKPPKSGNTTERQDRS